MEGAAKTLGGSAPKDQKARNAPFVSRVNINARLILCFALIFLLMLFAGGMLLWQSHVIGVQANRLKQIDEQLIEVMRVHDVLLSFLNKSGELAQARDLIRLQREAPAIRNQLDDSLEHTQEVFRRIQPENILDPTILPTLEAIQSPLPSQADSFSALASAGDWDAVRDRVDQEVESIGNLSAQLVDTVNRDVESKRSEAKKNIEQAEHRTLYTVTGAAGATLILAAFLGFIVTRSIVDPLRRLMDGAFALTRGDFDHPVQVAGRDELAHLGKVFNEMIIKLRNLYRDLQNREAYLAEAQELSHTGSFGWNVSTGEIFWSEETFRIFEYAQEVKPTFDLVVQRVHPDDRASVQHTVDMAFATKTDINFEHRLLMHDGRMKFLHVVASAARNGSDDLEYIGAVTDITVARQAELQLRRSEQSLRVTLETVPGMVWTMLPNGTVDFCNEAILKYCGKTLDELQDLTCVWHPEEVEAKVQMLKQFMQAGTPNEDEFRLLRHDGVYRWYQCRVQPLRDETGEIIHWYGLLWDIHERKQAEEERTKAFEEIEKLRDQLYRENLTLREELDQTTAMFQEVIGSCDALRKVLLDVSKVAKTDSTVLITGETGTGKELIARAIHKRSDRSSHAFISVNCAAIPQSLIASELFGHEKGAFTGATQRRLGRFELAHGGTIFLDELGELPAETQVALLRVLQERQFERVGGTRPISVDVRVLAATNRDLQAAIQSGTFRQDLFYRLNVFPIRVPPLRERREDIPLLVEYLIDRYAKKLGKNIVKIHKRTLELFQSYDWPGNVRELQNVVERAVILCDSETFRVGETWLSQQTAQVPASRKSQPNGFIRLNPEQEKEMIEAALTDSKGRISGPFGAAARLGIPRQTLESKMTVLGIDKTRFKRP